MTKQIVIFLGHPAHFHLFKNTANNLIADGYKVTFLIKRKDILEDLVKRAGYEYYVVRKNERKSSNKLSLAWSVILMDLYVLWYIIRLCPILFIGTYCPIISHFYHIPFICCNEDDAAVVPRFAKLSYPFVNTILTPTVCNCGKWEQKSIKYFSYQKMAYLHPNQFTPSLEKVRQYGINTNEPYFLLRFASLNAHHDNGIKGINNEVAQHLIDILSPHGKIYITSEKPLEPQFEQYRIHINPLDIHHVMAFASLYIGDSQTMAAEAGILGVPFVRFNDFVGRIGYLRELEDNYKLGYGIGVTKSNDEKLAQLPTGTDALYSVVEEILKMDAEQRTALFQERRQKMLSEKIDTSKFLTWFIENYPSSVEQTHKADTSFWNRFK